MFLCGNLRRAQLFSKYGLKSYPTCSDVGFHTRLIQQQNGNVILRRRAQIKQLLDQWQSGKLGTGSRVQSFPRAFLAKSAYYIPNSTKTIPDRGSVHTHKNGDFGGRDFCNEAKLSRADQQIGDLHVRQVFTLYRIGFRAGCPVQSEFSLSMTYCLAV